MGAVDLSVKLEHYGLSEADLHRENGHAFVALSRLGLKTAVGKACLACGVIRRSDGQNRPCKGHVGVSPR